MAEQSIALSQPQASVEDVPAAYEHTVNQRPAIHLLSCTNCRKRKVKCNKATPCSACERSSLQCVFPNRARLPRGRTGGAKATNVELLRRLNKLEELLEKGNLDRKDKPARTSGASPDVKEPEAARKPSASPSQTPGERAMSSSSSDDVLNRYMGTHFWKSLTNEVEGLRQTLVDVSDEDEESSSHMDTESSGSPPVRTVRIWGHASEPLCLTPLHPTSPQILMMCTVYIDNFDPIFKILHVPTLKKSILEVSSDISIISKNPSMEAFLFAMYYAAVTTLAPESCTAYFHEEKDCLLDRYRCAAEIALANAELLINGNMVTLQALVVLLVCIRCHDDSQFTWTLTAVAIRIAHSLELHRENNESSVSPYEQEMRRRLWWQIVILDVHASEDRGSEPMIHEISFNTKKPMNVNDEDLNPEDMRPVSARIGSTAMTLCAIGHEMWQLHRECSAVSRPDENGQVSQSPHFVERKLSMISQYQQHFETQYLAHCDSRNPICWVATMMTRLVLGRLLLGIYHPVNQEYRSSTYPSVTRERLLLTSVEIMEGAYALDREPKAAQWKWFFKSWVQWHALAVALAELCVQDQGALVQRAWAIVDLVFEPWATHIADSKRGMLWRPIQKMMAKARVIRRQAASVSGANGITPHEELPPPPYNHLGGFSLAGPPEAYMNTEDSLTKLTLHPQTSQGQQQTQPTVSDITSSVNGGEAFGSINWAEWDEFMHDYEAESRAGEIDVVQQDAKKLGLWF